MVGLDVMKLFPIFLPLRSKVPPALIVRFPLPIALLNSDLLVDPHALPEDEPHKTPTFNLSVPAETVVPPL
jgi:hypothetical protein